MFLKGCDFSPKIYLIYFHQKIKMNQTIIVSKLAELLWVIKNLWKEASGSVEKFKEYIKAANEIGFIAEMMR